MVYRSFFFFEELEIGASSEISTVITDKDLLAFAELSKDFNPVHMDEEYAKKTVFKGRIAHGMLSAANISAVLGTQLPGPGCIYVSQALKFKAPVRIGDTVVTKVTVTGLLPEKKFAILSTQCLVNGAIVIDGEATLKVPSRPA